MTRCKNCSYYMTLDTAKKNDLYKDYPFEAAEALNKDGLCINYDKWVYEDDFCSDAKEDYKLKPCPFCGKDSAVIKTETRPDGYYHYDVKYVVCENCGVRTKTHICNGYFGIEQWSDEQAAAEWNRRAKED